MRPYDGLRRADCPVGPGPDDRPTTRRAVNDGIHDGVEDVVDRLTPEQGLVVDGPDELIDRRRRSRSAPAAPAGRGYPKGWVSDGQVVPAGSTRSTRYVATAASRQALGATKLG